jgi:hypothetical protein
MPPRKRDIEEIHLLQEPDFSSAQQSDFKHGIALFNRGLHWHAHEAWEAAWLPMGNERSDDAEIFLRALIQLASGLHLKRKGRYKGARNQLIKAQQKFAVVPTFFMGLDCASLRVFAEYQMLHFDENFICLLRERISTDA